MAHVHGHVLDDVRDGSKDEFGISQHRLLHHRKESSFEVFMSKVSEEVAHALPNKSTREANSYYVHDVIVMQHHAVILFITEKSGTSQLNGT